METLQEKTVLLPAQLDETLQGFIDAAASFTAGEFNAVPYKDSWTPAQVAQHVSMSAGGFNDLINGPVAETQRSPDQQVQEIKETFLNFDIKMQSPDFVVPEDKVYNQEELLAGLRVIKANIVQSVQKLDLTPTCTAFDLPVMGKLTRLEAASFVLYHTQRHIHQLKKMTNAFAAGE